MSLLFDLPEDVSFQIVSVWIELREYGFADAALTSSHRSVWLKLLSRLPKLNVVFKWTRMPVRFKNWCFNRHILLANICISDFWFNKNGAFKGSTCWEEVEHLSIHCTKRKFLTKINDTVSSSCRKLTSISDTIVDAIIYFSPAVLSRLTNITLSQSGKFNREALTRIAQNCNLLTNLLLTFEYRENYTEECIAIVTANPHLRRVQLPSELEIARAMVQFCRDLENIDLSNRFADLPLFRLLWNLPNLKRLRCSSGVYKCENGRKSIVFGYITASDPGFDDIVQSMVGFTSIEYNGSSLTSAHVVTILNQSVSTLTELGLSSSDYGSSEVRNALRQCTKLTSLHWKHYYGSIFEISRFIPQLEKLDYYGPLVPLVKLVSILHSFPKLEHIAFSQVIERRDEIMEFKEFMYWFGVDHPKFKCEVFFENGRLRFKDGIFGGLCVSPYLTDEEKMVSFEDDWFIMGSRF